MRLSLKYLCWKAISIIVATLILTYATNDAKYSISVALIIGGYQIINDKINFICNEISKMQRILGTRETEWELK